VDLLADAARTITPAPRKPIPVNTPLMTRLVASTERTPSPHTGATASTAMALASPHQPMCAHSDRLTVKIAIEPDGGADQCSGAEAQNDIAKISHQ